jgi:Ca2+-binding RTX toxin-like protein
VLDGGAGVNTYDGGEGMDRISFRSSTVGLNISVATALNGSVNVEAVEGTGYNDIITGTAANDIIYAGSGFDTINAGDGEDLIYGGWDWDTINGGNGIDTVAFEDSNEGVDVYLAYYSDGSGAGNHGTANNDRYVSIENIIGSNYGDNLLGNTLANVIKGGADGDNLWGNAGDDTLYGETGNDTLNGEAGNDTLNGGAGADALDGGTGVDTISYADSNAAVSVNLATNAVSGGHAAGDVISNFENITGSAFNDTLTGNSGANIIDGGAGNDTITGGAGADVFIITKEAGANDTIRDFSVTTIDEKIDLRGFAAAPTFASLSKVQSGADTIITIEGHTITLNNVAATTLTDAHFVGLKLPIVGTAGNDTLTGTAGDDTVTGGAGADTFVITKEAGANDTITDFSVTTAGEKIDLRGFTTAPTFANLSKTQSGANTIITLEGHTITLQNVTAATLTVEHFVGLADIMGTSGNDNLIGTSSNDTLYGLGGNDIITGGAGADKLDGGAGIDTVSYATATAGVNVSITGDIIPVASYTGDAAGDVISNFENITGSAFNDTLTGNSGANIIDGGAGNDTITGGAGADVMDGGAGIDTVSYYGSQAAVIVDLNLATAQSGGDAEGDILLNIENVQSAELSDTLVGNSSDNELIGNGGNDVLIGNAGNDRLYGGSGNDTLDGGTGNDYLAGGVGINSVDGGAGNDTYVAEGTGENTFIITKENGATETIINFLAGGVNKIDLRGFAAAPTFASLSKVQSGADTIITIEGHTITLNNVAATTLTDAHFVGLKLPIVGTAGNDTLTGTAGDDTVTGGAGADTFVITKEAGTNDTITDFSVTTIGEKIDLRGFAAAPTFASLSKVQSSANTIITIEGHTITLNNVTATTLTAAHFVGLSTGPLPIVGAAGNDTLTGTAGDDTIQGLAGNDTLIGLAGADVLDGGDGIDTLSYATSNAAVNVNLTTRVVSGGHAAGDVISNVENVTGSNYNDTIVGTTGANILVGGNGTDAIDGGAGADVIEGGAGADTLNGGHAIDTLSYATSNAAVNINLATNSANGGHATGDVISNFENITGSNYYDVLTGTAGVNIINAGNGNDIIDGGAGADSIDGGLGYDTITYATSAAAVNVNLALTTAQSGGDAQGDRLFNIEHIIGSTYDDVLGSALAVNTINGGAGIDTVSYARSTAAVTINLALTTAQSGGYAQGDILSSIENIIGSNYADMLTGALAANNINGGAGVDTVSYAASSAAVNVNLALTTAQSGGHAQGDVLTGIENLIGSKYNDTLTGNATANNINGGAGVDTVSYAASSAAVNVNLALTTVQSGGHAQGDVLTGIENLIGSKYNDTLTGNATANNINGGAGVDTVSYAASSAAVNVNLALTTAQSGGYAAGDVLRNIENLMGSNFGDTLIGNTVANQLNGYGGNDTLDGGAGNDYLAGGSGINVVAGGAGNDTYVADSTGENTFIITKENSANDTVINFLAGASNKIDLRGFTAAPTFANLSKVQSGANTIITIEGHTITLQNVTATALTAAHFVGLATTSGLNTGTAGNDTLTGTANADVIYGLGGNDTIIGTTGIDTIDGGAGVDTVSYINATARVLASLDIAFRNQYWSTLADAITNVENVTGSNYDDVLRGNTGNNVIRGEGGSDNIFADVGADTIDGGAGNDLLNYYDSDVGVNVNLAAGTASGGFATGDIITNVEHVYGSLRDDILTGDANANSLNGQDGNDTLTGGAGNDHIQGYTGNDILDGGADSDSLFGGLGVDRFTGGTGADKFYFEAANDSGIGAGLRDIIADFSKSQGDKIDLSVFTGTFNFNGTGAFSGVGPHVNYAQASGNTIIGVDADGNNTLDFQIELVGLYALVATDFVL